MFKRKTFNIVREEDVRKRDNLYQPKRCPWMKYIVIPALIGFMLLLILMNVDFSDKTKTESSTISVISDTVTGTELLTTVVPKKTQMQMHLNQKARSYNLFLNTNTKITNAARCNDQGGERCTIICSNGNVNFIDRDLEDMHYSCSGDLSVILDNCTFPLQQLLATTFNGFFHLKSLAIINSDLVEIVDEAFKIESMSRMTKLNLSTTAMMTLTEKSFEGLIVLQELKLLNVPNSSLFEGLKFLQPLAKTLQQVSLCQKSNTEIYDPLSWLDGNEKYSSLTRVDLSGNNFANTLSQATFSNLVAVRELILTNCSITDLDMNTFAGLTETLEYLDLSSNAIKILDISVLVKKSGLRLELKNNSWICSCDNYQLIKALQSSQFTYNEEPFCVTPSQWKDKPLQKVTMQCGDEPPLTQKPPASITTVQTTSSSLETTASTTKTNVTSPTTTTAVETSAKTKESDENEDDKTTTIANITTTSSPPKPTHPKPTPSKPPSPAHIQLVCHDPITSTNNTISIRNCDARFTVRTTSSRSVVLLISSTMQHLRLIYFTDNNKTYTNITQKSSARSISDGSSSTAYTIIHVESLVSNQTYIFCLMPLEEQTMSPFNCQSHHIEAKFSSDSTSWLQTNDQAWFYISVIFGILLIIILGLLSVYLLLRWRPTWLRGCNRIIKADDVLSHEVYLLPKPQTKPCEQDYSSADNHKNSDKTRSNLTLGFNSCDYLQSYKDLQDMNIKRELYTLNDILPPTEQAPAVPQNQSRTVSLQSTIPADDLIEYHGADDGNDYQSISYYDKLF